MIDDATRDHVAKTCASAAGVAAVSALQSNKPLGYATLEGSSGEMIGVVVVCLSPAEAKKILGYIASNGGFEIGRLA